MAGCETEPGLAKETSREKEATLPGEEGLWSWGEGFEVWRVCFGTTGGKSGLDLERGRCCEDGNGGKEGKRMGVCGGKRCGSGKIVRFVEEVEVVELVGDEERKRVVGLKRRCEIS